MQLALIADVHANGPALEGVLARARALGAEQLVFLGDIVGYGPDPVEVTGRVAGLMKEGAIVVMGNHDEAAVKGRGDMHAAAAAAILWTHQKLGYAEKKFLARLPLQAALEDLLFVHAEASDPASWIYVTGRAQAARSLSHTSSRVTFCGHMHRPALFHLAKGGAIGEHKLPENADIPLSGPRKWLLVCGSAGQPRDGNPAVFLGIYDTITRMFTAHRVPYDVESVASRIRAAGLPDSLATRLLTGH